MLTELQRQVLEEVSTGPLHAYDLVPNMGRSVYSTVRSLQEQGLVSISWEEGFYNRPRRKMLTITADGKQALK